MIILVPFLVCLIGLVVYIISTHPKISEVGKDMFWTGLLVTLFDVGRVTVDLLR
jgi:hypothetical protein